MKLHVLNCLVHFIVITTSVYRSLGILALYNNFSLPWNTSYAFFGVHWSLLCPLKDDKKKCYKKHVVKSKLHCCQLYAHMETNMQNLKKLLCNWIPKENDAVPVFGEEKWH